MEVPLQKGEFQTIWCLLQFLWGIFSYFALKIIDSNNWFRFVIYLNHICCDLTRKWFLLKVRADVKDHPELYSLIYTPHPAIVPGMRFRELYYWWVNNEAHLLAALLRSEQGHFPARGFLRRAHRGAMCRRWQELFLAQQGHLLGHQRAPAVRDDRDCPWDDTKLPLPCQQVNLKSPLFICIITKKTGAVGSSAISLNNSLRNLSCERLIWSSCGGFSCFVEWNHFSAPSPTDMALFQTVGGFTMKGAVSLHSSL